MFLCGWTRTEPGTKLDRPLTYYLGQMKDQAQNKDCAEPRTDPGLTKDRAKALKNMSTVGNQTISYMS